jgi:hypothetical protein
MLKYLNSSSLSFMDDPVSSVSPLMGDILLFRLPLSAEPENGVYQLVIVTLSFGQ